MRSSADTTVSRTSERIDSLRRRRRGRRVSALVPRVVWSSVGTGIVFVVIFVSVKVGPRAGRRAVAAAARAVGAVGTVVTAAGNTTLEAGRLFTLAAADATPFVHEKYSRPRGVEYTSVAHRPAAMCHRAEAAGGPAADRRASFPLGGVAQMVRAGVS